MNLCLVHVSMYTSFVRLRPLFLHEWTVQSFFICSICFPSVLMSKENVSLQRPFKLDIHVLFIHDTILCISVGQGPPVVTAPSVSTTLAPHITASITRITQHPSATPTSKSATTKMPPSQPSVTEARDTGVTSTKSTTARAAVGPGILERRSTCFALVLWSRMLIFNSLLWQILLCYAQWRMKVFK